MALTEDDMYRSSTQYRLWNFTPERLAALRQKTNSMAREHVKAALKRKRKSAKDQPEAEDVEIDFLTVDEERTLIDFFCVNLVTLARHPSFQLPTNVVVRHSAERKTRLTDRRPRPSSSSSASSSPTRS
jgi:cyclin H